MLSTPIRRFLPSFASSSSPILLRKNASLSSHSRSLLLLRSAGSRGYSSNELLYPQRGGAVPVLSSATAKPLEPPSDLLLPPSTELSASLDKMSKLTISSVPPTEVNNVPIPMPDPNAPRAAPATEVTVLPSGLTVASVNSSSHLTTIGVLLPAGSRFETEEGGVTPGSSHLYELMCMSGSLTNSALDIQQSLDDRGSVPTLNSSREQFLFCIDTLREHTDHAMGVISDCLMNGDFNEGTVGQCKEVMEFQQMDMPNDLLVRSGLQTAAYGDQQLGVPHFAAAEGLKNLNLEALHEYKRKFLTQDNLVLCAAGIDHSQLVEYAKKYFGDLPQTCEDRPKKVPSSYTGGEFRHVNPCVTGLTRVAVAFEVGGWHSKDLVATCVLQVLLGGGDSFSAGGPGKGMYSRLYREVLNRFYWVEAAECFTSMHDESGLLGITGASIPSKSSDLTLIFLEHFAKLAVQPVMEEELSRAKNMLKCNVLTQLESRVVMFEDIGRQMLTYGKHRPPSEICAEIENVSKEDIMRVAKMAMSKAPSISCVGADLSKVPSFEQIRHLRVK
jgi:processing peptidase subunit alpha